MIKKAYSTLHITMLNSQDKLNLLKDLQVKCQAPYSIVWNNLFHICGHCLLLVCMLSASFSPTQQHNRHWMYSTVHAHTHASMHAIHCTVWFPLVSVWIDSFSFGPFPNKPEPRGVKKMPTKCNDDLIDSQQHFAVLFTPRFSGHNVLGPATHSYCVQWKQPITSLNTVNAYDQPLWPV